MTSLQGIGEFLQELRVAVSALVVKRIEEQLEAEMTRWLKRDSHQRRGKSKPQQSGAVCCRCGTRQAQAFSRNGHRKRQMVTGFGVLTFWLPRAVCQCGGSVRVPFSVVRPYQRVWEDVAGQVARWAQWGVSLRQMQAALATQCRTQVGLRKLNTLVHQHERPSEKPLRSVPPVVMLDAIWVPLLQPVGEPQSDRAGRRRPRKQGRKVCVLVALGLYPQHGQWGILGWRLAEGETRAAWEGLLLQLEARGVYRERGVALFIHDGGQGLIAALQYIYPHVPHQRCLFHKLRNLYAAIDVPEHTAPADRIAAKRRLMKQLKAIYAADTLTDANALRDAFRQQWQARQPRLVTTLLRDWPATVTFYHVRTRYPHWKTTALRTTSLLERVNRMLRRLFRAAGAFHSSAGLSAAVWRVLSPYWLV